MLWFLELNVADANLCCVASVPPLVMWSVGWLADQCPDKNTIVATIDDRCFNILFTSLIRTAVYGCNVRGLSVAFCVALTT